jgi:hypothetical protein
VKRVCLGILIACAALAGFAASASAAAYHVSYPGLEHLNFNAGPYMVHPGANLILVDTNHVPKPSVDGFMVRMAPNLKYALPNGKCCGKVPYVSVIHLHHGVWLSTGAAGAGEGNSYGGALYPFMATGEEKTAYDFPQGYGYPVGASDKWILNYMIHNLTAKAREVYINYSIDFVPASDPASHSITPVHPIWMDVEDHHIYPVFNVKEHSGVNGKFTFPDMAKNPYGSGAPLNEFTIDHPGTLIMTAGHLHPGGLYNTLDLIRPGAHPSGGAIPGSEPNSVRLFRSYAHYFDKRGPISWDLAMGATAPSWRPQVKAGDVLRTNVTYNTTRASWYEVMGIMVVWEAWDGTGGTDPFTHKLNETNHLTHGYLKENNDDGGMYSIGPKFNNFPQCLTHTVTISNFMSTPATSRPRGLTGASPRSTRASRSSSSTTTPARSRPETPSTPRRRTWPPCSTR